MENFWIFTFLLISVLYSYLRTRGIKKSVRELRTMIMRLNAAALITAPVDQRELTKEEKIFLDQQLKTAESQFEKIFSADKSTRKKIEPNNFEDPEINVKGYPYKFDKRISIGDRLVEFEIFSKDGSAIESLKQQAQIFDLIGMGVSELPSTKIIITVTDGNDVTFEILQPELNPGHVHG